MGSQPIYTPHQVQGVPDTGSWAMIIIRARSSNFIDSRSGFLEDGNSARTQDFDNNVVQAQDLRRVFTWVEDPLETEVETRPETPSRVHQWLRV